MTYLQDHSSTILFIGISFNILFLGSQMLKQNGSAVDAAIAVCFCIGVANRYSSGIGGGKH